MIFHALWTEVFYYIYTEQRILIGRPNHTYLSMHRSKFVLHLSGANPTKLFFFVNEEFFRFLLLSLAVVQYTHFFTCYKLSSLTAKIGKPKKWKFGRIDSRIFIFWWLIFSPGLFFSHVRQKVQKFLEGVFVLNLQLLEYG